MNQDRPKDNQPAVGTTRRKGAADAADDRAAQRQQNQSQAAQLSQANVEESPHMDRRDSAEGSGESLMHGDDATEAAELLRRGGLDTQYGTKSWLKTGGQAAAGSDEASGSKGSQDADREGRAAPNPGSSEHSSGAERDTMTSSRPGRGA